TGGCPRSGSVPSTKTPAVIAGREARWASGPQWMVLELPVLQQETFLSALECLQELTRRSRKGQTSLCCACLGSSFAVSQLFICQGICWDLALLRARGTRLVG
ncbi:hypothetical protein P7K49_040190, partial [Saguinus oedipus]